MAGTGDTVTLSRMTASQDTISQAVGPLDLADAIVSIVDAMLRHQSSLGLVASVNAACADPSGVQRRASSLGHPGRSDVHPCSAHSR